MVVVGCVVIALVWRFVMTGNLNLDRFKPALGEKPQTACAETWPKDRAFNMLAGLTIKAINNYPEGAIPWAMIEAPELYECQREVERSIDDAFERQDLDGVRECCRNYADALKALFEAFEADRALAGTQLELVS
jgi:hypothetical protein